MTEIISVEGELAFSTPNTGKPCSTWYKVVGRLDSDAVPIVMLHGGPGGAGSVSLVTYLDLYTKYGIPVIMYDQLGCGKSTHLPEKMGDATFWTFELFQNELDNLIDHLNLREKGFYLGGPSWGGMLAASYASRRPRGLKKLVLSNSPSSCPLAAQGINKLLAALPPEDYRVIQDCHAREDFDNPDYRKAVAGFTRLHFCRMDPWPEELLALMRLVHQDKTVFKTMHGPSELVVTGSYKDWEGWRESHNIEVEALLLTGRYSYLTDIAFEPWFRTIPKVKWVSFENSAHMPQFEERERYMDLVAQFLIGSKP